MRYFYDTEFIEDGATITLISIGIVAEDGREYYAVSTDFDPGQAGPWVTTHVLPKLPNPGSHEWKSQRQICREVHDFVHADGHVPQLWAWAGDYDHVVLAQLFGAMTDYPSDMPRFTYELRQYWEMAGRPSLPPIPTGNHDALVDARHNRAKFAVCMRVLPLTAANRVSDL
ncbi:MAG: polyadenylate-specific 3'-exoribonuclease AS [Corynebacterium sp.]|nr:polyadenylate-specific 3'-exoribonuclease AS [Corynebacterium sp.]